MNSNGSTPTARRSRAPAHRSGRIVPHRGEFREPVGPRLVRLRAGDPGSLGCSSSGSVITIPRRTPATTIGSGSVDAGGRAAATCCRTPVGRRPTTSRTWRSVAAQHGAPRIVVDGREHGDVGERARHEAPDLDAPRARQRVARVGGGHLDEVGVARARRRAPARSTSPRSSARRARCASRTESSPNRGTPGARPPAPRARRSCRRRARGWRTATRRSHRRPPPAQSS